MAGLHFDITGDNTNLMEKLKEVERGVKSASASVEKGGGSIEQLFSRMSKAAAAFGAGFTAKELIQNIVQVRGEFQQLEVAFTTMLGSQEKATSLMSQLTETAAKTPSDLQGVANGARQLLAYGTAAEDVNETLVRLGNIAAGLSIPLNDLVYLYGTTMTQGRLYTQDLNQFTGRGIPMIKELAKEFGVAESEIKSMVEAGKIGFPEVQKVIQNLTDEGGMFYNLMQEQSKTITGQISNIGDSFSMMLNEIGKANEGIINDALGGVSYLIENYETVGRVLLDIVGTYGAYRAALITITALQKAHSAILAQSALNQSLLAMSGHQMSNAQALAVTRTKLLQMAQAALNKTLLANPYALVAAAVAALGVGLYKLVTYQTEAEKAQERLNDAVGRVEGAASSEMAALKELNKELTEAEKGSDEWYAVKEKIVNGYSKYLNGIDEEIERTGSLAGQYENLQKAIRKSIAARSYSNFAQQEEEKYNSVREENLKKAYEYLTKTYGDEKGLNFYRGWLNWVDKEEDTPAAVQKAYEKGGLNELLQEIRNQDKIRKQKLQEYLNIYEIPEPEPAQSSQAPFSAEGESISQLEEEIGKAQTKLESLKKAFADGSGTKEAVSEQEAYIKSLQDTVLEREKDLKVINEVEAQISKLKKEQKETVYGSDEYNSLQNRINALDTKLPQTKSEKNEANKIKENRQKLSDELLELQRENQEQETALMEEGTAKKLKQINDDYEAQKAEIKKKSSELAELNKKAGISGTNGNGLTAEQQKEIDRANELNDENKIKQSNEVYKAEREAMNRYLQEYGDYWGKRLAIADEYAQKISEAGGEDTWEGKILVRKRDEDFSELDIQAAKTTSSISKLFGDMTDKTLSELRKINEEGSAALDFLKGGEWNEEKGMSFGITQEQFNTLSKSPEMLKAISDALRENQAASDALRPSYEKVKDALNDIFNAGNNSVKLKKSLSDLQEGLNEIMQAAQFLSDTFSSLGDAFGSDALSGIAEGINVAMGALNAGMQGAQAGAMFGPIGSAAGAALGVVSSLAGAIAKIHDKKNEKRIQRLQGQIDTLSSSYNKLGNEIEKAYSKSAQKLIEDQNKVLEQKILLMEAQIREEEEKKKTDEERIKQWREEIDSMKQAIAENKESASDAIYGEDIQSAISNFVDAYTQAWDGVGDRATAAKDTVKQMMQKMVTESIKDMIKTSNSMEQIRNKLKEFYADNVLTGWEQDYIYNMAEELQKDLDEQFGWADSLFGSDKAKEQQSASSGGYETMTQDQASELNGRFTALYEVGLQIYNTLLLMQTITVSVNEQNSVLFEIRNLIISSNGYLEDMSGLQKKIYELLKASIPQISNQLNKL